MPLKLLHITAPVAAESNIKKLASEESVISYNKVADLEDDHAFYTMLTRASQRQKVIDALQLIVSTSSRARIDIVPVDATLPAVETKAAGDTREELLHKMEQGCSLDFTYILLTFLSTVVALIGLLQDNVAVVVGAMVIAPFLGPNLAFAFGTSQGNQDMMARAFRTGVSGVFLATVIAAGVGYLWGGVPQTSELMGRTSVDLSGVALAVASGVAGVLSLTTGLSMTLVGVMVAVALLPPAATLGFMIGAQEYKLALGALMLLSVNIVCVNLSGLIVFMAKGIRPRHWFERKMAKPYVYGGILFWSVALAALLLYIAFG